MASGHSTLFPLVCRPAQLPAMISTLFILLLIFFSDWTSADVIILRPNNITEKVFIDYELTFTAPVPSEGFQGLVQVANPPDGCNPIKPPPFIANSTLKWFVLIERYPCSFDTKVKYAQAAGYHAAIVYNVGLNGPPQSNIAPASVVYIGPFRQRKRQADKLTQRDYLRSWFPFIYDAEIDIPGILIGQDDGRKIKSEYTYSTGFTVIITPDSTFNLNNYLLPFAIVIGFCFVIVLLFMIVKCLKDRRRSRRNRLSSRHLKHLPVTKFKSGDKYEVCAVCLEDYCEGEKLRILPCSHAYHTKCIDPWLTNNRRNCPICKRKVAIPGVTPDSDSDSDTDQDISETTPLLQSSAGGNAGAQSFPVNRTNGGTFSSSASSSAQTSAPGSAESRYSRLHEEDSRPGPSSRSSSYQEAVQAQLHSPPPPALQARMPRAPSTSSSSDEEDVYHSSSQLLAPDNGHSINKDEDDYEDAPPVLVVVAAADSKSQKKSRSELVV